MKKEITESKNINYNASFNYELSGIELVVSQFLYFDLASFFLLLFFKAEFQ